MSARTYSEIAISLLILCSPGSAGCSRPSPKDGAVVQSRLVFDGVDYQIAHAEISGYLPNPEQSDVRNKSLQWSIYVEAAGKADNEGGETAPHVDFDGLDSLKVKDWQNLTGASVLWTEPINDKTNNRYGLTYVWDHQLITKSTLKIVSRKGTQFRVVSSGENERGQRFAIDATVEFTGIRVEGSDKDNDVTVKARLSQHVSLANLKAQPYKMDLQLDPLKVGHAMFEPVR